MEEGLAQNPEQRGPKPSLGTKSPEVNSRRAQYLLDYRKRISNHVAFGLLVYTGLHIFVTIKALKVSNGSILPYFSLVILVAAIIPVCRWFEKRWERLDDAAAADLANAPAFRRDVALIWLGAIGLPVVFTLIFKVVLASF